MTDFIRELMQRSDARIGRSTALQPLMWLVGGLLAAIVTLSKVAPESWLLTGLFWFLALAIVLYVASYGYLLVRNPDALRSERFTLSKMAIERGLRGDSLTGLMDAPIVERPAITASTDDAGLKK